MRRLALPLAALLLAACTSTTPSASPASAAPSGADPSASGAVPSASASPAASGPVSSATPGASPSGGTAQLDGLTGSVVLEPDALERPSEGLDTPCDAEGSVTSTDGGAPSHYSIANQTQSTYAVYWLDRSGARQKWFDLPPGAANEQDTPVSHAWLVANAAGKCLAIFHAPADLTIRPTEPQPTGGPLFPTPTPADPGSATSEDAIRASLLADVDLPAGARGGGADAFGESSSAFTQNGGLRAMSQQWSANGAIGTVFDIRWQFSDAASAARFLAARADALSESASGLKPDSSAEAAGENAKVYSATINFAGVEQRFYNFLFTRGNFAAKVFVAGDPSMDAASASAIAKAADGRIQAVTGQQAEGGYPNEAERALLGHVPAPIATGCERDPNAPDFAEATLVCGIQGGGAEAVKYLQLRSRSDLDELYRQRVGSVGKDATGSSCKDGPSNSPWSINGTNFGQVFCYAGADGGAYIEWTDERLNIYSLAFRSDTSWADLYAWWANDAGPNE